MRATIFAAIIITPRHRLAILIVARFPSKLSRYTMNAKDWTLAFLDTGACILCAGIAIAWWKRKDWLPQKLVASVTSVSLDARWLLGSLMVLLLATSAIPVVQRYGWPQLVSSPSADEIASAVIKALAKNQQDQPVFVQPSDAIALCSDGPCAPVRLKPGPEYLKGIGLGVGGAEPLLLNGTSAVTTDRLRVFVDYSEYRSGWMEKTRAFIGEIKEPVKGQTEHLQLVYYEKDRPNAGQIKLWWGEPTKDHPVTQSIFDGAPLPAVLIRARLAIVGPSGEQHYYFLLVRSAENVGTQVGVIAQHDSGDWIENWEKE